MAGTLPALMRSRRRGTDKGSFSNTADPYLSDTLGQGATAILLEAHEPDLGHADIGPTWVRHPNSVSSLQLQNDVLSNNSGSGRSTYYANIPPGTVAYTVRMELKIQANTSGNNAGPIARCDPTRDSYYSAEIVPIPASSKTQISLGQQLNGAFTRLQLVDWWPSLLTVGQVVILWLKVSNERKVIYAQGPGETAPRRITSDGRNNITEAGFAGVTMLRSLSTDGQHPQDVQAWTDGNQDPGSSSAQPTPDPVQVPAVLWVPPYGTAVDTLQPSVWFREQEPFIRGVAQTGRLSVVTGASVPGSGTYKPNPGALQAISNPYSDPPSGAKTDFEVTATAAQDTTTQLLTLSAADVAKLVVKDALVSNVTHEKLYVQGFPSSTTVTVLRNTGGSAISAITVGDTFDVPGGDVSHSGSETDPYFARRVEVYDRFATDGAGGSAGGTAPSGWPDPVGSVRWYSWSMYFDPIYYPTANPTVPNESGVGSTKAWGPIHTQWKGSKGGSPPIAIPHDNGILYLGGTKLEGPGHTNGYSLGAVPKGVWKWYVVGIRWETSSLNGWVEAYVNGVQAVPRIYVATMDVISGAPDPVYLKEGMYVSGLWDRYTGDLVNMPNGAIFKAWYSPVRVCSTKELAMSFFPG